MVRIPVHVQALYSKYKKLRYKLEHERGEEVSDEELAPMLGVGQTTTTTQQRGGCRGLTALSLCLCVGVQISLKRLRQHMMLCKPQRFLEDTVGSVSLNGDAVYMYEICGDSAVSAAAGFLHTLMIEK